MRVLCTEPNLIARCLEMDVLWMGIHEKERMDEWNYNHGHQCGVCAGCSSAFTFWVRRHAQCSNRMSTFSRLWYRLIWCWRAKRIVTTSTNMHTILPLYKTCANSLLDRFYSCTPHVYFTLTTSCPISQFM